MVTSFVAIILFQALYSKHFQSHCVLEGWWMVRCRTDRGDLFGDTVQDGAKTECVTLTLFHRIIPRNESLMPGPIIVQCILRVRGCFSCRHTNVCPLQWESCLPCSSVCEKSLLSHHGGGTCHLTRLLSFHPCRPFVVTQPDSAKMYFQISSLFGDRDRRA